MKLTHFKTLGFMLVTTALLTLTGCDKSGTPSNAEGIVGVDRTAPIVTLVGGDVTMNEDVAYVEQGATAVDDIDGNIPVVITGTVDTATPGVYILTYTATDSSLNASSVTRTVTVLDITPPVITLNGDANVTINQGETYTEENATAVDNVDGSVPVVITGTVDTDTVGVYTLTYTATDSSLNESSVTRTVNVESSGLDGNITINNAALLSVIASIYDNTPYDPAINYQGVINAQGLSVAVPYTVVDANVTLPAYATTYTIDSNATQNDESGIIATFAWEEQNLSVGSGTFVATITIDDSAGDNNGTYMAKKLDIEDDIDGIVAATFSYPIDNAGGTGTLTLKIMPGVPDRMFGQADNSGDDTTHMFLYLPVTNAVTGKTWLNNNLGAKYANVNDPAFNPEKQATTSDDYNAYGSLFQWGRKADGHELIDWTGSASATPVNGTTSVLSDNPTDELFILGFDEWRVTPDSTLWSTEASVNNVCPVGYRVPTEAEILEETSTWTSSDAAGALASTLKIPTSTWRDGSSGSLMFNGESGLWLTTSGMVLYTPTGGAFIPLSNVNRAHGLSVRCIKD